MVKNVLNNPNIILSLLSMVLMRALFYAVDVVVVVVKTRCTKPAICFVIPSKQGCVKFHFNYRPRNLIFLSPLDSYLLNYKFL